MTLEANVDEQLIYMTAGYCSNHMSEAKKMVWSTILQNQKKQKTEVNNQSINNINKISSIIATETSEK